MPHRHILAHAQRPAWRLYSIVVDPARRGQGFGAVLLADAEAIARAAGPYGHFGPAMRTKADQIAVVSRFRFTRDETLNTTLSSQ